MEIRLLGPLQVLDDRGTPVDVPGVKLRSLLSALALRPGEVVSTDRLIDELWGERAPAAAGNSLQQLVSKLRRLLPDNVLATRPPGYALDVPADSVDVGRFDSLVLRGRKALADGDFGVAIDAFEQALLLWRGPVLDEFRYEDFAQAATSRLDEERASVQEDLFDARLGAGGGADLVAELEAKVALEPLRERRRGQLMVALYRAGRQADALRQYQEARRVLGDELGLEPGPELRRLEASILTQDPGLTAAAVRTDTARDPGRRRTNLRVPPTATVGRDAELASLTALLSAHRLVTVVGPGGVGKTRLAIEIGLATQSTFADGAWLVELGPLRNPDDVVAAVARRLGIANPQMGSGPAPDDGLAGLTEVLAERDMLIILDNCEHLIDESARVGEALLASCPRIRVLTTSREALRLPGEALWPAQPLAPEHAAALFEARAGEVTSDFKLTDDNRRIVLDICSRLDGLPLAIELAAARVRAFPVAQVAARLDDRFKLLTRGTSARTAVSRQQTLHAVVDWSYDLLFEDERRLFNRLSLFVGGCDLEAMESVCADDLLPKDDIADVVARLVDKSLVVVRSDDGGGGGGGQARFSMLYTLAEYGREQLLASGELDAVRARHASCYFAIARVGSDAMWGGYDQKSWLGWVSRELGNLGLAVDSAVEMGDANLAVSIVAGVSGYFWVRGHPDVGLRWFDAAMSCPGNVKPRTRAMASVWASFLGLLAGRPTRSTDVIDEAIGALVEAGDVAMTAFAKFLAMQVYAAVGDRKRVPELAEEARDGFASFAPIDPVADFCAQFVGAVLAHLTGDEDAALRGMLACAAHPALRVGHARAFVLVHAVDIFELHGRYAEAAEALNEARRVALDLGMSGYDVPIMARMSNIAILTGDTERAVELRGAAVEAARLTGFNTVLAATLAGIATRQLRAGHVDASAAAAAPALVLYREADDSSGSALTLVTLGWNSERQGDAATAASYFARGVAEARRASDSELCREAVEGLSAVALLEGDAARAARLLGVASRLYDRPPQSLPDLPTITGVMFLSGGGDPGAAERIELDVRKQLGPAAFRRAFAAGGAEDLANVDELAGLVTIR